MGCCGAARRPAPHSLLPFPCCARGSSVAATAVSLPLEWVEICPPPGAMSDNTPTKRAPDAMTTICRRFLFTFIRYTHSCTRRINRLDDAAALYVRDHLGVLVADDHEKEHDAHVYLPVVTSSVPALFQQVRTPPC